MNYPHWDVPIIGSGLVIALIAVFHVFISHFAVGGGLYLPVMEWSARRRGREDWLVVLRQHTKFFLILTGVFGAVTGVAIWFSIGLGSPEGASTLIRYWVFAWAMEWGVFVMELTAIAVYFYLWDRVDGRTHLRVGWFYAFTSWMTLAIINGILGFMLTPTNAWLSAVGTGQEANVWWHAFFNATYWPSLFARMCIMATLAGVFAMITASRMPDEQLDLKAEIIAWSRRWLLPGFVLFPLCMLWYFAVLPPLSQEHMRAGISTIAPNAFPAPTRMIVAIFVSSFLTVIVAYVATDRMNTRSFKLGAALGIAFCAYVTIGAAEMCREMARKPYVVYGYQYSNGTRPADVDYHNQAGYTANTVLASPEERARWQQGYADPYLGELMLRGQCITCHTTDGYRSMKKLLAGRNHEGIRDLLRILHEVPEDSPYKRYMPQLVGTPNEIEALAQTLASLLGLPPEEPPSATPLTAPSDPTPPGPEREATVSDPSVAPVADAATPGSGPLVEPFPPQLVLPPGTPIAPRPVEVPPVGAAPAEAAPVPAPPVDAAPATPSPVY